jgi:hypothetical protein
MCRASIASAVSQQELTRLPLGLPAWIVLREEPPHEKLQLDEVEAGVTDRPPDPVQSPALLFDHVLEVRVVEADPVEADLRQHLDPGLQVPRAPLATCELFHVARVRPVGGDQFHLVSPLLLLARFRSVAVSVQRRIGPRGACAERDCSTRRLEYVSSFRCHGVVPA